jgi:hypothetical protein
MLPNSSGLDDMLFPMTAQVYYSASIQSDYGNVIKSWVFDREVKCSAISSMSKKSFSGELGTKGTDFIYQSDAFFRTKEDLRRKGNGQYVPITAVAIGGIKDPNGQEVWINGQVKAMSNQPISTKYEIRTIVPTFDENHNFRYWRTFVSKSEIQRWDQ